MDDKTRGLILLMKSAITAEACVLPEKFDLEQICQILCRHNIQAIGYLGARNCRIDKQSPGMQKLFSAYLQSVQISERQLAGIQEIYSALDGAGIDYMPVKGCNMKPRYPHPELRMMGDADILIRESQYGRIREIMIGLGFAEGEEVDHVAVWTRKPLMVELHKRLIPSDNQDFFRYYGDGWKFAARREGTHFYMSPEDEFVYVFTHMAKHYRYGGIGFRQLLDLWILQRTYPELDGDYIAGEMKKLGLLEFYRNICRTLEVWFSGREADQVTDLITDYILDSGCWGSIETHEISSAVETMESCASMGQSRVRWVLSNAFPSVEHISVNYPIARKYPAMLPAIWVWRWIDVILTRPGKIRKKFHSVQKLTDKNLLEFQKSLHAVGLDFRFDDK